ncbi:Flavoredoxin [Sporomusa silvacetica DSM 10669]|uniref:Flavoredoxin n=1 Tax=Sporomusa silvacetica DSM 10669 TaxID=1123289 RepID=A0ABZ3IPJ4_9FIRM|nr:flavin reductase family protein [Sporomusa silvacetica]OZC14101.1 flavoredoxin [Sporomusa silvacetica DSM 10669]
MKKSIGAKTFAMPTPVWVIGTYGENDEPNIMTAAWGGICCSEPPCVTVSLQKIRASYDNILNRKAFTVSIPSKAHVVEADYAGMVSGKNTDKFTGSGLTAVKSDLVDAPYVQEFPLILECQLLQTIDLGMHTQFIGKIVDVKAEDAVLGENGLPNLIKVSPISYSPPDRTYFGMGPELGQAYSVGSQFKK